MEALGAAVKNEKVTWEQTLPQEVWKALFDLAESQHVLPMICDAVYGCPAAEQADAAFLKAVKRRAVRQVMAQTQKTAEFLGLYRHLEQSGVEPILVKGLICRELYPNPDHRCSGDEDLLIRPETLAECHNAMLACGMAVMGPEPEPQSACEVSYGKPGSPLHIEVHPYLFPMESEAYGDLNGYFTDVYEKTVRLCLQDTQITTLDHTSHFFYLICHAFKHFLHSGFGIRQVCDIGLYANAYGSQVDWQQILTQCTEIRADRFAAAVLRIAEKYLSFSRDRACCPPDWGDPEIDASALLEDLLSGGVYGGSSVSRMHSSNMTLDAVAARKRGVKARSPVRTSLFPSARKLQGKYPYLKKYPVLLPVAWCSRILKYSRETFTVEGNSASDAVRIGKSRIALLREYGIID